MCVLGRVRMVLLLVLLELGVLCAVTPIASHAIEVRWLGVAGLSISDGETTLLIDPAFTKPSIKHWIFNSEFRSDPERVKSGLLRAEVRGAQAIFASHCHFDHAVDVARVSEFTGAVIYGGASLRTIAQADPSLQVKFSEIKDRQGLRIGKFTLTPYRRDHPPIFHLSAFKFLPGEVPDDFHFRFFEYHEGEVWGFRIEHPEASLLVDQSSHFFDENAGFAGKIDAYFVGVANKVSLNDLVENNIIRIRPPLVVPLHFDFFVLQSDFLERMKMPGMQLDVIQKTLRKAAEDIEFRVPERNRVIEIRKPGVGSSKS
ncbi:MAG: MBL fold metallo-hydrolase [Bdellovibrionales bacterium]|nr:MBL fold metallo-hydrolase [Bdellovibrionales bacterium]